MKPVESTQRLRSLPVQLIHTGGGVILKRGCTEIQIQGEHIGSILERMFSLTSKEGLTKQALLDSFPTEAHNGISQLIDQLIERRLFVAESSLSPQSEKPENPTDIFYWHFHESQLSMKKVLNAQAISVLGVNYISKQLIHSLQEAGFTNMTVIDDPALRNRHLFEKGISLEASHWPTYHAMPLSWKEWEAGIEPSSSNCLIATSDFGLSPRLRELNRFALERHLYFFPIVLSNMIGSVGPLVIPQETPCWECVLGRQNSHLRDPSLQEKIDSLSWEGQNVVGFHPSMASILGDIATVELTKFFSNKMPRWNIGKLVEVNLLATKMVTRKVLKLPRCLVCSPLHKRSATTPDKPYTHFSFSRAQE